MKKLIQEQINKILECHKHWLNEACEGWETMGADFSSCDLRYANLRGANLGGANLHCADLSGANLHCADLSGADLSGADLSGANLHYANLRGANLGGANLHCADLSGADLSGANLRGANLGDADLHGADLRCVDLSGVDLSGADLHYANLRYADLCCVDLSGVDLSGADLSGANLCGAKGVPYVPMACPEEGDFIGWKRAGDKIVKLHIPQDALRSSATTRKCRCNKAEVVEIYNIDGTIAGERTVNSSYDSNFTYEVGKTVEVQDFDTNRWEECTRGIHFFISRQEAINY